MRLAPVTSLLLFFAVSAQALHVDEPLADGRLEAQAQELFADIRCAVCKSQSLAESSADIAADMRLEIRSQLQAGKTQHEIMQFLTQRYGEGIRMQPPLAMNTALLWLAPLLLLAAAGYLALGYFRQGKT